MALGRVSGSVDGRFGNRIVIASAITDSYVSPLAVMLESLRQNLAPGLRPLLYLLHSGIPQDRLAVISSILETRSIVPSPSQLSVAIRGRHYPAEASFPLLLGDVLPAGLDRVLFLDADMLILGDMAELWAEELGEYPLAAIRDAAVPFCSSPRGVKGWEKLGIPADAPYFNAGVMLIDLPRFRKLRPIERVRRYFETTTGPIDLLHQEALNAMLWNQWRPLDTRWNLLATRAGRSFDNSRSDAWKRPGIVHFAGRMKPWRAPIGGPFNQQYQEVLDRVRPLGASAPASVGDRLRSIYDRHLRTAVHPLEQLLWRQRII